MKTGKEQVLSSAIDVPAHTEFPVELSGTKLYGEAKTESGEPDAECRIYKLSNETGTGKITAYRVFSGVELYYNDMHMAYCNKDQMTAKNMIEINHCLVGRYECSFGENSCCYMAAGDLSIGSVRKKKSFSCFPLKHYHGITVVIDLEKILPEVRQIMEFLGIDLAHLRTYICEENRCCIMRANPSIKYIFSELYHEKEQQKPGYRKIKMMELLLFLSDLDAGDEILQTEYFSQAQVARSKQVAAYLTEDLSRHETIGQLADRFQISPTALKRCFKGIYGTSIYAYLKSYRMQEAQKLLLETELSVGEIAAKIGYENPNKFTSAFKKEYGVTPTGFKNRCPIG